MVIILASIIVAVVAGVISHLVCKWLDGKDNDENKDNE